MVDSVYIHLLCPKCGQPLVKVLKHTKGNWQTSREIKCGNKACEISTGEQPTMSDAYEALCFLFFGADSNKEYEMPKAGDNNE